MPGCSCEALIDLELLTFNAINFFAELARRNVICMAGVYLVAAWLLVQVSATLLPVFDAPSWVMKMVVLFVSLGFIPALVASWIFELTPAGLVRDVRGADQTNRSSDNTDSLPRTAANFEVNNGSAPRRRSEDRPGAQIERRLNRAFVCLMALALGYFLVDRWRAQPSGSLAAQQPQQQASASGTSAPNAEKPALPTNDKSIVILPFVNLSAQPEQDYFADGMAEEMSSALSKIRELEVTGRTASRSFKGQDVDVTEIGKSLHVAHALEGSVQTRGEKVRIIARLMRTSDGLSLWAERFDGDMSDVFALQERIARAIAVSLQLVLSGEQNERLVNTGTDNISAYALYLRASSIFNRREGSRFPEAMSTLQEALKIDPRFARAHSRLAALNAIALTYLPDAIPDECFEATRVHAELATDLDPLLAEPYAALGVMYFFRRMPVEARLMLEKAAQIDPKDATANFWLATLLLSFGYQNEGLASIDRALAVDPLLPNALAWRGTWHMHEREINPAQSALQSSVLGGLKYGEVGLAMLAHQQGNDTEAIERMTRGAQLFLLPPAVKQTFAQGMYGTPAQRKDALAMLETYLASKPKKLNGGVPWALLLLGQPERALNLASAQTTTNDSLFFNWLWSPVGANARRLPAFAAFLEKTGHLQL